MHKKSNFILLGLLLFLPIICIKKSFAGGLISNFDGTSVGVQYSICSPECRNFSEQIKISGDTIIRSGSGKSLRYRYGSNKFSHGTESVSIIGNTISISLVSIHNMASTITLTLLGGSCSYSMKGQHYPSSGEQCRVLASAKSSQQSAQVKRSDRPQGAPDQRCLLVEKSTIGGGCELNKRWHWTRIRSKGGENCPASIEFTYFEPNGSRSFESPFTPISVQTCGGPPTNVLVRQR